MTVRTTIFANNIKLKMDICKTRKRRVPTGRHQQAFGLPRFFQSPVLDIQSHHQRWRENRRLVSIHRHSLRVPAEFALSGWADGPATRVTSGGAALLQSQQLLGTENLVVKLARSFNKVLKVSTCQEVSKIHEFAVVLVLDVDDAPAVLTTPNLLSVHHDVLLTSNNGKRNDVLTHG
jgi:hypothetical protein